MSDSCYHLHNVFFTLSDGSPENIQHLVDECHAYLKPQPGVLEFAAGPRATDCAREVNDQDFHVALTILFTNRKTHNDYQAAPKHAEFVNRNKTTWSAVRVFDSDIPAE